MMRVSLYSLAVICLMISASVTTAADQPNIVMILSDDQAWTDYGFMGHPAIQTPHLDRLAARSAVFRRGYTPVALCRPSLMSMITGLYPHQHGVTGNDPAPDSNLADNEYRLLRERLISGIDGYLTLPKLLSAKDYLSMQSGKWWEGHWSRGGFTHGMTRGFPQPGGRHGDDGLAIGRETMQPVFNFIAEARSADKPFFLWYAPMLPHTPHDPPERLLAKYSQPGRQKPLAKYFAMCEFFDESCGQLLDHLDQQELSDNTIVLYVTDNGWIQATPDMNLGPEWKNGFAPRSKQTPYEGGIRTPIMISWPGRIEPGDRPTLASTLDVLPTLLSAVGIDHPPGLPGCDLLPLLRENIPLNREFLYGESFSHDIADLDHHEMSLQYRWCIERNWKLILSYESPPDRYAFIHAVNDRSPQLFDIEADPQEQANLASQHPERVRELSERISSVWPISKSPIMSTIRN